MLAKIPVSRCLDDFLSNHGKVICLLRKPPDPIEYSGLGLIHLPSFNEQSRQIADVTDLT